MKLLVIRNSAMGDVTLLHPCFKAMKELFPAVQLIFLTKSPFDQLFKDIDNVTCITGDYQGKHKGITGLIRLAGEIYKVHQPDIVLDLHDVLRSKVIRSYFKTKRIPVHVMDKNRKARADLISGRNKKPLPHIVEVYADVFKCAGFDLSSVLKRKSARGDKRVSDTPLSVGIAPFAKHELKTWPLPNIKELMRLIQSRYPVEFYLFGGKEDLSGLQEIEKEVAQSKIVAGKYTLNEELELMKSLDVFISMDSANMHLANLAGIKVYSIWGATDPLAGFSAWNQPPENSISISLDELRCRPCTVYGRGTCYRKDLACLNWLTPEKVFTEMEQKGAFI